MKATFFCKPVNKLFEDPVLFIKFARASESFLFDLGDIRRLTLRQIHTVSHVFVTHMHIDHFIGFDMLVRGTLAKTEPITIFGPAGIIAAVEGKLRGYTWNLIQSYSLRIEVFEVADSLIRHAGFYARSGFVRVDYETKSSDLELYSKNGIMVTAAHFDHAIPVLGYVMTSDVNININKAALKEHGFEPGPWLNEFKKAVLENDLKREFVIGDRGYLLSDIHDLAIIAPGQKVAYITDIAQTVENIEKAVIFAKGADILYIEAFFMMRDAERASTRWHITTATAGEIGLRAMVKAIEPIHASPKYVMEESELRAEVFQFWYPDI